MVFVAVTYIGALLNSFEDLANCDIGKKIQTTFHSQICDLALITRRKYAVCLTRVVAKNVTERMVINLKFFQRLAY